MITLPAPGCAYRESSHGDSSHSRIIVSEAGPVFRADDALNRASLHEHHNPNIQTP